MLNRKGKNNENGSFDWEDAFVDAGIMAGLTFFTTLGAISVTGVVSDPIVAGITAGIACATQFFLILAMKRGLKGND